MQGFKYIQKSKTYHASNNALNLEYMQAVSYNWFIYFKQIDGLNVFNAYPYSSTTQAHQRKMKALLEYLNIPIHVTISDRSSLNALTGVEDVTHALYVELSEVELALGKLVHRRSRKRTVLEAKYVRIVNAIEAVKQRKAS